MNNRQRVTGFMAILLATTAAAFPVWTSSWIETQHRKFGRSLEPNSFDKFDPPWLVTFNRVGERGRGFLFSGPPTPHPTASVGMVGSEADTGPPLRDGGHIQWDYIVTNVEFRESSSRVDLARLGLELGIILFPAMALAFLMRSPSKPKQ